MRIVIHCGLPKTGSTAFQLALWEHRSQLLDLGYYFPEDIISPDEPVHGFIVRGLRKPNALNPLQSAIERSLSHQCHTLIVSSETISIRADELSKSSYRSELREVLMGHDVELIFVLRNPDQWKKSFYRQRVLNVSMRRLTLRALFTDVLRPHDKSPSVLDNAVSIPYCEFEKFEELQKMSDRGVIAHRFGEIFDNADLRFFDYSPVIVDELLKHLGLPTSIGTGSRERQNATPPDEYIEIIRRVNAGRLALVNEFAIRGVVAGITGTNHLVLNRGVASIPRTCFLILACNLSLLRFGVNNGFPIDPVSFERIRRESIAKSLRLAFKCRRSSGSLS